MRRWSRLAVVAAAAVGIAVVACAADDPARPRAEKAITYADGRQLDLYRPVRGIGPLPAVVLVHGGGFVEGSRQDLAAVAEALARRGYVAVTIDYQLSVGNWFPATTLDQPGLSDAVAAGAHDLTAAVEWLRANAAMYRVDPERIAAVGYSAGGITALAVAAPPGPPLWAAVAISAAAVDPARLAGAHAPLLLLHGDLDDVIPVALADQTAAAANAGGRCEVHHYDDADHYLLAGARFQDVVGRVDAFLASLNG